MTNSNDAVSDLIDAELKLANALIDEVRANWPKLAAMEFGSEPWHALFKKNAEMIDEAQTILRRVDGRMTARDAAKRMPKKG